MHVVRHQAPCVKRHSQRRAISLQIAQISAIVIRAIENDQPPMTTLHDMVRLMSNENAGKPGHDCASVI
ncbi:hypothetical protein JL37_17820 [Achromobacter sp. RTa]|nr:hypothetical protein JL37_17820 [Achromobacter sp. RTa]